MAKCNKCGAELLEGALFCTECGEALTEPFQPEVNIPKNPFEDMINNIPKPEAASPLVFDDPVEETKADWSNQSGYGKPSFEPGEKDTAANASADAAAAADAAASFSSAAEPTQQENSRIDIGGAFMAGMTGQEPNANANAEANANANTAWNQQSGNTWNQQAGNAWDQQPQGGYGYPMGDQPFNQNQYNWADDMPQGNDKIICILGYFTLLIWFICYLLGNKDGYRSNFQKIHLNQALILHLIGIASGAVTWISAGLGSVLGLGIFVLAVMGIINAAKGIARPLPIIGDFKLLK